MAVVHLCCIKREGQPFPLATGLNGAVLVTIEHMKSAEIFKVTQGQIFRTHSVQN